jgi:sugar lactone lactonase YvrE
VAGLVSTVAGQANVGWEGDEFGEDGVRAEKPAGHDDGSGATDGAAALARFFYPSDVEVSPAGTLYITDGGSHTIRCISASGEVSTLAGSAGEDGAQDGQGSAARFCYPDGVVLGPNGSLFVSDSWNFTIRRVSPEGHVSTVAGVAEEEGSADGPAALAHFYASDLALGPDGTLFIADYGNSTIRCLSPGGIVRTLAGVGWSPFCGR